MAAIDEDKERTKILSMQVENVIKNIKRKSAGDIDILVDLLNEIGNGDLEVVTKLNKIYET